MINRLNVSVAPAVLVVDLHFEVFLKGVHEALGLWVRHRLRTLRLCIFTTGGHISRLMVRKVSTVLSRFEKDDIGFGNLNLIYSA